MRIISGILRYAKLKPSEEKNFRLLFIQTLLSGFGTALFFVVASAQFIKKASSANLPIAYVLSGLFGILLSATYKSILRRFGSVPAYSVVQISFGVLSVVLFGGMYYVPDKSPWSLYIAYAGFMIVPSYISIIALGFSTITLKVFNFAQSKRLLALISSGEVAAALIAYMSAPFLIAAFKGKTEPLLLFAAVTSFVAVIPLRGIAKHNMKKLTRLRADRAQKKMGLGVFVKDRFYLMIAVVSAFSVLAVYFVDYTYLHCVHFISAEYTIKTATIVAVIFSVIKFGELIFSLLSRGIISSRGMKFSLLSQPVVLLGAAVLASVLGAIFWGSPLFIVAFLLFNKWAVRVVGKTLTAPASKVLYLVTDHKDREQLQANIDGTLYQYVTILSGGLLLIVAYCFDVADPGKLDVNKFLEIIAVICMVTFGIWVWCSERLFSQYKIRIREYLNNILKAERESGHVQDHASVNGVEKAETAHHSILDQAHRLESRMNRENVEHYIVYYNPAMKNFILGDTFSFSVVRRAYYNNENFFSRLLIIWHASSQAPKVRLSFFKEFYKISELPLRLQMMKMLNKDGFRFGHEDQYFFTSLCEETVSEILWTEAALNDVSEKVNQKLIDALLEHSRTLQNLLFELLKLMYEQDSVNAIQEVVNSYDKSFENQVFAVELLDNMLDPEMKKLIIPLFEDISFNAKKDKLQKIILVYNLSCNDRLKEILMSNFMTVGPYIKQLALEEYFKLTSDETIISAFTSSSVENLRGRANLLLNNFEDPLFTDKLRTIKTIGLERHISPTLLAYFTRWGLFTTGKKRRVSLEKIAVKYSYQNSSTFIEPGPGDTTKLSVDMLGLSLMLMIKDNHGFLEHEN